MITLPASPAPRDAKPSLLDYGLIQRPATGAGATRIDRPGSRFTVEFSMPPMVADVARVFVARLLRAKREGLRMAYPLLGVSQGLPGNPVVDGAGQAGTTLALRGCTPGYRAKEGYWLAAIDADGARYLHNVAVGGAADASGDLVLGVEPPLRAPFADGAAVLLAKPEIEGIVTSVASWSLPVERLIEIAFTIEEAA